MLAALSRKLHQRAKTKLIPNPWGHLVEAPWRTPAKSRKLERHPQFLRSAPNTKFLVLGWGWGNRKKWTAMARGIKARKRIEDMAMVPRTPQWCMSKPSWSSLPISHRDDEVGVPKEGMMVLIDGIVMYSRSIWGEMERVQKEEYLQQRGKKSVRGSIRRAFGRSFTASGKVLEKRNGIETQSSGEPVWCFFEFLVSNSLEHSIRFNFVLMWELHIKVASYLCSHMFTRNRIFLNDWNLGVCLVLLCQFMIKENVNSQQATTWQPFRCVSVSCREDPIARER